MLDFILQHPYIATAITAWLFIDGVVFICGAYEIKDTPVTARSDDNPNFYRAVDKQGEEVTK